MPNWTNIVLLVIVAILIIVPLAMYNGGEEDEYFGGSDDQGGQLIEEENPDYEVWAEPIWEPPSGEIQSLLFCVQTAIGAIIIGYLFGYWNGQNRMRRKLETEPSQQEYENKPNNRDNKDKQ